MSLLPSAFEATANVTTLGALLEAARHRASVELTLSYANAPPLELAVVTVTAGVFLCACLAFSCVHMLLFCIRCHRRLEARRIDRIDEINAAGFTTEAEIDDSEDHEMEVREARRSATTGDSSEDELSPQKERV